MTSTSPQSSLSVLKAFSRAYRLFGDLMLYGPVEDLHAHIHAIPELAEALPRSNADELSADHFQTLGFEIHPYESTFLDPDGLIGGRVTESVLFAYRAAGFTPRTDSEAADHIGWELHFLAYLCDRQARMTLDFRSVEVARLRVLQYRFLGEHLLRWLPVLVETIHRQENPFYTAVGELTLALAVNHYDDLSLLAVEPPHSFCLQDPPDLLLDESTGLRDIAGYLLTPVFAGVYFSPLDIRRIARKQQLPRGFGDRRHMLTSLLRNSAEYDQMPVLVGMLRQHFESCVSAYQAMEDSSVLNDSVGMFIQPWRARARQTIDLLRKIERLARDYSTDEI